MEAARRASDPKQPHVLGGYSTGAAGVRTLEACTLTILDGPMQKNTEVCASEYAPLGSPPPLDLRLMHEESEFAIKQGRPLTRTGGRKIERQWIVQTR